MFFSILFLCSTLCDRSVAFYNWTSSLSFLLSCTGKPLLDPCLVRERVEQASFLPVYLRIRRPKAPFAGFDPAAARGGKGDYRPAGEVAMLQKRFDDPGCEIPPDRVPDKYPPVSFHLGHPAGDRRPGSRIAHLDTAAALRIAPIEIGSGILLGGTCRKNTPPGLSFRSPECRFLLSCRPLKAAHLSRQTAPERYPPLPGRIPDRLPAPAKCCGWSADGIRWPDGKTSCREPLHANG